MEFDDQIELTKEYLEDAHDFVDDYESKMLQLEQMVGEDLDPAVINEILGALHTFKGNSGMMGFTSLQKYAHKLEDLFKAILSRAIPLDPATIDLGMSSVAAIRRALAAILPDQPADPDLQNDIAELEQFLTQKSRQGGPAIEPSRSAVLDTARFFGAKTNVLKVDFQRLDHLLNLMGELVIYRTRLGRIENQVKELMGEKGISLELTDTVEQMGKVSTELHEAIMKVRMLPINHVFRRFPGLVRDLSRERGKRIELLFEGEDTELDKTIIDEIGEPLLHLLRNAIDHGIEPEAEREAMGKPGQGVIYIRAYQESSHIIIEVEDDGRGIDQDKLRKKAEQMGLLARVEGETLNLTDLIFLPGISTAETVTEVSGRGLGMDVVKKSLAKINGVIEIESEKGSGTRFTIKLPLTLAIISALMVEVSGEQYAVPLSSVAESIKVKRDEIHFINNREVIQVRDRVLPLIRLSGLFGLDHTANGSAIYVVVVQTASGQAGLIVNTLLGQQEIVIKALDDYLGKATGVAGATILGDGKVVLIVDVMGLVDKTRRQRISEEREDRHA